MSNPYCRSCSDDEDVSEEQINRMIAILRRIPSNCVAENIYNERLAACSKCEALMSAHTCRHCGCFVQVRALLKERSCPSPGASKWT
ncbi:DUF6171 family protein [Paenibacillus sp. UNC451MF]|uniref:DUF6171 family protein n=1 Tax=Paenibacillus sp. UNC451MF TaxID=1449063 RepID=UPI003FA6EAA5